MATGPDSDRMMKFMPDPRLQQKPIPHGINRSPYSSGEIQNYRMDESLLNGKGKYLKPLQSGSRHSSSPHINKNSINCGTGLMKERESDARHNNRRISEHLIENRLDQQFAFARHESTIVGKSNQQDMNLDSLVHNLLDSLDEDSAFKDQSQITEDTEEQEEDFPTKYANYQRSYDDYEQHAVALPCDPRFHKPTAISAQASSIPPKRDTQPTEKVKPEPREKITGPERDNLKPANNLKQALEDIRQRPQSAAPAGPAVSYNEANKGKNTCERSSQRVTQSNVSSNDQGRSSFQSPDVGDIAGKTRRKVVEDPRSRSSTRSSRNDSPMNGTRQRPADKSILGSPEWHRQVRLVENPDNGNSDSREREMRRVRRLSRSRSRSRSRSPRRSQRYFRHGSPDPRRSRSRSPTSRRVRRTSPEYPHRRWGAVGPKRNSRSPIGCRDRKGSPSNSIHRSVVERTVIMRRSSRSASRSPSSCSSHQRRNPKRLEEQNEESKMKPHSNLVVGTTQTTQLFTRSYAVANQIDHVARNVQPPQPVATQVAPRYAAPPNSLPTPASVVPPVVGYYNQLSQTPVQQLDMATYQQLHQQQLHQQQLHQQQFQKQQLLIQQQIQQQLYQRHSQQMSQTSMSHNIGPSSSFPASHPAGLVPAVHNIPPPQATVSTSTSSSTSATIVPANSEKGFVEEQRIHQIRDGLLEKQTNLIHQFLVVQTQQADLEMKQKTAKDTEYDSFSVSIMEKAKFRKEMMVSAQALEKLIQKHTNSLKEDLSEIRKTRSNNHYSYYDPQQHWCELCDVITDKLSDYLNHLHSKEHEERLQSTGVPSTPWHKKHAVVPEEKGGIRVPFNGLQNLQPVKAWYCELCDVWMGDLHCAQLHMTSSSHNDQHLKRNMERPDSALSQTVKKQAALRRNIARKKEEERVRNQQKEADRLKVEAEKKEMARKKENELQEKQRRIKQKWQEFVRNEEANTTIELEGEKDGSSQLPADSSSSTGIRLNIHTPIASSKSREQKDSSERPIPPLMDAFDSTGENFVDTADEAAEKCITEPSTVHDPTVDKSGTQQQIVEDVQMQSVENRISSIGVMQKDTVTAVFGGDLSGDVPEISSSSLPTKLSPNNISNPLPDLVFSDEKYVNSQVDLEPGKTHQTDAISNSLVNVPEQVMPISQTNVSSSSPVPVASKADSIGAKFSQELIRMEEIQQVHINVQDHSASSGKTVIGRNPEGSMDVEASVENGRDLISQMESYSDKSEMLGKTLESATAFSQQNSDADESQEKTAGLSEKDGGLLPKVEPKDSDDATNECCVILEVNPKLDKIPELIDLESSGEDSDPSTIQLRMSPNSESVEEKCGRVLSDANRSSTPCNIQFGEFIVLSETREDSYVETDNPSTDSSSGTPSQERRGAVKKAPPDGASAS